MHCESEQPHRTHSVSRVATWSAMVLAVLLAAYVSAYFVGGEKQTGFGSSGAGYVFFEHITMLPGHASPTMTAVRRQFRGPLEARWFIPIAWLEAKITRRTVLLAQHRPAPMSYPGGIEILNPVFEP